ncbi:MAG: hypothetical protein AAGI53_10430 [Planctomycetota bacterium]
MSLWGPGACAAELWFDLEIIEYYEQRINNPADRFTVPTAHHERDTLDDAVFFAFHCGPTLEPPYISTIVALSVGHAELADALETELQDPNHSRKGSPRVRNIAAWSPPL